MCNLNLDGYGWVDEMDEYTTVSPSHENWLGIAGRFIPPLPLQTSWLLFFSWRKSSLCRCLQLSASRSKLRKRYILPLILKWVPPGAAAEMYVTCILVTPAEMARPTVSRTYLLPRAQNTVSSVVTRLLCLVHLVYRLDFLPPYLLLYSVDLVPVRSLSISR